MLAAPGGGGPALGRIQIVQVDERVAAADSPDRNLIHLRQSLLAPRSDARENIHAMPVEDPDLAAAAAAYAPDARGSWPVRRRASILSISASDRTATPRRWCPAIPCST